MKRLTKISKNRFVDSRGAIYEVRRVEDEDKDSFDIKKIQIMPYTLQYINKDILGSLNSAHKFSIKDLRESETDEEGDDLPRSVLSRYDKILNSVRILKSHWNDMNKISNKKEAVQFYNKYLLPVKRAIDIDLENNNYLELLIKGFERLMK